MVPAQGTCVGVEFVFKHVPVGSRLLVRSNLSHTEHALGLRRIVIQKLDWEQVHGYFSNSSREPSSIGRWQ